MKSLFSCFATVLSILFLSYSAFSQSPGQIVKRASVNTILDPVPSSGYTSANTSGFKTNDITESRIPFKVITLPFAEPIGDLATGSSGGFTDLITSPVDKSGFMVNFDGTNLIFRLRVGGISSGAKGYSILIDADNKAGNSGPQADPNYVAPTSNGNGNIGFEWEVLLTIGNTTRVTLYETDGKNGPNIVQMAMVENDNFQISQALTNNSGNPDYFFDFYLPIAQFSGLHSIISSSKFRMMATTVNSPTSALTGNRSDIFGVDDVLYPNTPDGWLAVLNNTPPVTIDELDETETKATGYCTAAPTLNGPINIGTTTISGNWTRTADAIDPRPATATIRLYKIVNGAHIFVTGGTATSGLGWSIPNVTVASGDVFIVKAVAANESECLQSNVVSAGCIAPPSAPVVTSSSTKGICGTAETGTTIMVYLLNSTGLEPTLVTTLTTSGTSFNYGSCSGAAGTITGGTYMLIASKNGCLSSAVLDCNTTGNGNTAGTLASAANISLNSPIYSHHASITGTLSNISANTMLRLFIDNNLVKSQIIAASTTTFTFDKLLLKLGSKIKVTLQSGTNCATVSANFDVVCYNQPPVITTDGYGKLLAGTTVINGIAAPNAQIALNRISVSTANWSTTASSTGAWSITLPALVGGDTYRATVTSTSGCSTASEASPIATVASVTTDCPSFTNAPYTDANNEIKGIVNVAATGSIVRAYLDGYLIGSSTMNTIGTNQAWSIISSVPFYNGGVIRITFQSGTNGAEKRDCPTSVITCTSPAVPGSIQTDYSIYVNQTATFNLTGIINDTWYAITDNTGKSYATSIYATSTSNFSVVTNPFLAEGTYNLNIKADNLSGCEPSYRPATVMVANVILPVRFVEVQVKEEKNIPQVSWRVSEEQSVNYYSVERSYNGLLFEEAGRVFFKEPETAINKYAFADKEIGKAEQVYYRIKQVDNNGKYIYSKVVSVKLASAQVIQIMPNPAYDKTTISVKSAKGKSGTLQLLNAAGVIVKQQQVTLHEGQNQLIIKGLQQYTRGSYYIKFIFADVVLYKKIVLQ